MKSILAIMIAVVISATAFGQEKEAKLQSVSGLDLNRYAGKWYEIAKYPNKFQKQCVGNVTATYTLKQNGRIEVLNQCLKKDGVTENAKGEAKVPDKSMPSKLKVRFAPGALSWLPFVWANYWVIDLDPNYRYAVIGEPDRDYFWILSREPEMNDATYQAILRKAEANGFNPARVEKTPQNVQSLKGGVVERN
ncbi:MAG: lipocalin family protein [Pyrinomonadaceae bacterium]|nr:lipocalin family protein [Pyrinomonadaceae bacterium]